MTDPTIVLRRTRTSRVQWIHTSKMGMSVSRKYRVNAIHSTSRVEDDLEAQDDRLYITSASIVASVSLFLTCSPFAAVCLCGVAGLAHADFSISHGQWPIPP